MVKVSKTFQVLIPKNLRESVGIKPRDKMAAIIRHGIIQYISLRPTKEIKGFILGLNIEELRDEPERINYQSGYPQFGMRLDSKVS